MRVFAVTAEGCESGLPDFAFERRPVNLGFLMPAEEFREAVSMVTLALLEEGIVPDRVVRTRA